MYVRARSNSLTCLAIPGHTALQDRIFFTSPPSAIGSILGDNFLVCPRLFIRPSDRVERSEGQSPGFRLMPRYGCG